MNRIKNIVVILASLVGAFYGVGFILPRSERDTAKARLIAKPGQIYQVIADVGSWPDWHPDVIATRDEGKQQDRYVWTITPREGEPFELQVTKADPGISWQATYSSGPTSVILNFVVGWFAEGGRMHLTVSETTRDPWQRARLFFTPREHASATEIVEAISAQLGESGTVEH